MMRDIFRWGLACTLFSLVGCSESKEEIAEELPTPSQAARTANENPTSPDIDVPGTPIDEEAQAEDDTMPAPAPEDNSVPVEPAPEEGGEATPDETGGEPIPDEEPQG